MCLMKGTLITLSDYSKKPIEEITYDDNLLVWDFDNGKLSTSYPIWISSAGKYTKYNKLTFENNHVLNIVHKHRLFNKNKFIYDNEFKTDDISFDENGKEIKLINKEEITKDIEFYSLMSNYNINIFAEGILTSSRLNNMYEIKDMKFQKPLDKLIEPINPLNDLLKGFNLDEKYIEGFRIREQTIDWVELIKFLNERHLLSYSYGNNYSYNYNLNENKSLKDKKYLFLDHQGVLNDFNTKNLIFNKDDVKVLLNILSLYKLEIIVSSDWTRFMSIDNINKLYKDNNIPIYIDFTSPINSKNREEARAREIFNKIIELKLDFKECLIIDDLDLRSYFPSNNFMWIKGGNGLKSKITFL